MPSFFSSADLLPKLSQAQAHPTTGTHDTTFTISLFLTINTALFLLSSGILSYRSSHHADYPIALLSLDSFWQHCRSTYDHSWSCHSAIITPRTCTRGKAISSVIIVVVHMHITASTVCMLQHVVGNGRNAIN